MPTRRQQPIASLFRGCNTRTVAGGDGGWLTSRGIPSWSRARWFSSIHRGEAADQQETRAETSNSVLGSASNSTRHGYITNQTTDLHFTQSEQDPFSGSCSYFVMASEQAPDSSVACTLGSSLSARVRARRVRQSRKCDREKWQCHSPDPDIHGSIQVACTSRNMSKLLQRRLWTGRRQPEFLGDELPDAG
jgi:hypothetical protein